jgi:uncharacterized membrane protein SirB2|tara:strand:- start:920 stop:1300 length:381 start_codon:yes stop_codon:yes gene_type:complete
VIYLVTKNLHITLAALSLSLFLIRAMYSVRESPQLERRWAKVLPHLVDTLLLICGLTLMVLLKAWPHQTPWLSAKLIALCFYIGIGTMAIKRARTPRGRALFTFLAILVFAYMASVAITKTASPFV